MNRKPWASGIAAASCALALVATTSFAATKNSGPGPSSPCGGMGSDVTITANPNYLWPPNHKMVPIYITATDGGSSGDTNGESGCFSETIMSITSNQEMGTSVTQGCGAPDATQGPDYSGIGNTATGDEAKDVSITDTAFVRAERCGSDPAGRTYTITVNCVDEGTLSGTTCTPGMTGHMGTGQVTVFVPHDQRNKK